MKQTFLQAILLGMFSSGKPQNIQSDLHIFFFFGGGAKGLTLKPPNPGPRRSFLAGAHFFTVIIELKSLLSGVKCHSYVTRGLGDFGFFKQYVKWTTFMLGIIALF